MEKLAIDTGRHPRWPTVVLNDLAGFGGLALISLLVGLLANPFRHQPLPVVYRSKTEHLREAVARLGPITVPISQGQAPREIELDEFQDLVLAKKGVVIDARSPFFYHEGHVPGAINVSREGFDADYRQSRKRLDAHKAEAVAVYCSGSDCQDSNLVAEALRALGFQRLLVYREGWEQWSQTGLPQEK